jgi:hypothetical protein
VPNGEGGGAVTGRRTARVACDSWPSPGRPPPYPHDRLRESAVAGAVPAASSTARSAHRSTMPGKRRLADARRPRPGTRRIGAPAYREAAQRIGRRFGIAGRPTRHACIGTGARGVVAPVPRSVSLATPCCTGRRTRRRWAPAWRPAVSAPRRRWHLDLSHQRARCRALVIWVNRPGNPTGASAGPHLRPSPTGRVSAPSPATVLRGFTYDGQNSPAPATVLGAGHDRVAVHSLSKRSNIWACGRLPRRRRRPRHTWGRSASTPGS